MAEKETKSNNKSMIAVICAVVVVVLVVVLIFAFTGKKSEGNTTTAQNTTTTQQGSDYASRLGAIQEKIDAQQKVIDDLNNEMTPLIEKRTDLEEQLVQLSLPDDEVLPEDTAE